MTCMHVEGERWGHTTLASFPGSPLTLTKNKNIIFFRQGEGRAWERGYTTGTSLVVCDSSLTISWHNGGYGNS